MKLEQVAANPENIDALKTKTELSKLVRHSGLSYIVSSSLFLSRFLKSVIFARLLGPFDRGAFGAITVVAEMVVAVGILGTSTALTYYLGTDKKSGHKVLGVAIVLIVALGVILATIAGIICSVDKLFKGYTITMAQYRLWIVAAIPLILAKSFGTDMLTALNRVFSVNIIRLLNSNIPIIAFVILVLIGVPGLLSAVAGWYSALVIMTVVSFFQLLRDTSVYPPQYSGDLMGKVVLFGVKIHFSSFFQTMLLRSDYLLVSAFVGPVALGYYAVATSLAEILLMLPESVAIPLIPILLRLDTKDIGKYTPIVARFTFMAMMGGAIASITAGPILVPFIFGKAFYESLWPFLILQPGIVAYGLQTILRADMLRRKMPGVLSAVTAFAAILNFILNLLLIPKMSINGAAFSSSVAYSASAIVLAFVYCRITGQRIINLIIPKKDDVVIIWKAIKKLITKIRCCN